MTIMQKDGQRFWSEWCKSHGGGGTGIQAISKERERAFRVGEKAQEKMNTEFDNLSLQESNRRECVRGREGHIVENFKCCNSILFNIYLAYFMSKVVNKVGDSNHR